MAGKSYLIAVLRGVLLITAIYLISYSVSTPGTQALASVFGGVAAMWSITFQVFER